MLPSSSLPRPLRAQDQLERLVPGNVAQADGDLAAHVVGDDDVLLRDLRDDPQQVVDVDVLELEGDPLADVARRAAERPARRSVAASVREPGGLAVTAASSVFTPFTRSRQERPGARLRHLSSRRLPPATTTRTRSSSPGAANALTIFTGVSSALVSRLRSSRLGQSRRLEGQDRAAVVRAARSPSRSSPESLTGSTAAGLARRDRTPRISVGQPPPASRSAGRARAAPTACRRSPTVLVLGALLGGAAALAGRRRRRCTERKELPRRAEAVRVVRRGIRALHVEHQPHLVAGCSPARSLEQRRRCAFGDLGRQLHAVAGRAPAAAGPPARSARTSPARRRCEAQLLALS